MHHLDQPAVIPHVALQEGRRLPLEVGHVLTACYASSASPQHQLLSLLA